MMKEKPVLLSVSFHEYKENGNPLTKNIKYCRETCKGTTPGGFLNFFADFADNQDVPLCPSKTMTLRGLFCFVFILGFIVPCLAQDNVSDAGKQFTADVLKTRLFARTTEDQRFCDYVVQKRDDGMIPSKIFYVAYQKAMTKESNRRFLYFKTTLEILCEREGIALYPTPVKTSPTKPTATATTKPTASSFSAISSAFRGLFNRN